MLGVVVRSTLQQHQQELLEKDTAIPFLLAGERRAELRMAHRLFALVDGAVEALAKQFKTYISACGEKVFLAFMLLLLLTYVKSLSRCWRTAAGGAYEFYLLPFSACTATRSSTAGDTANEGARHSKQQQQRGALATTATTTRHCCRAPVCRECAGIARQIQKYHARVLPRSAARLPRVRGLISKTRTTGRLFVSKGT